MNNIKLEILGEKYMVTSISHNDEEVTITSRKKSHLLNEAFIIGAKEIIRATREELDELYEKRDSIMSMISEKEEAMDRYNKKIKEFSEG